MLERVRRPSIATRRGPPTERRYVSLEVSRFPRFRGSREAERALKVPEVPQRKGNLRFQRVVETV